MYHLTLKVSHSCLATIVPFAEPGADVSRGWRYQCEVGATGTAFSLVQLLWLLVERK